MSMILIHILSGILGLSWASLFTVLWLEFGTLRAQAASRRQTEGRLVTI